MKAQSLDSVWGNDGLRYTLDSYLLSSELTLNHITHAGSSSQLIINIWRGTIQNVLHVAECSFCRSSKLFFLLHRDCPLYYLYFFLLNYILPHIYCSLSSCSSFKFLLSFNFPPSCASSLSLSTCNV